MGDGAGIPTRSYWCPGRNRQTQPSPHSTGFQAFSQYIYRQTDKCRGGRWRSERWKGHKVSTPHCAFETHSQGLPPSQADRAFWKRHAKEGRDSCLWPGTIRNAKFRTQCKYQRTKKRPASK